MSEQRPTFVARKNPGSGWGVDILWPDGETEVIKGFITEYDALKWITEHEYSKAWPAKTNENHPKRPRDSNHLAKSITDKAYPDFRNYQPPS